MKDQLNKDFGPLADKGWSQLSKRLDKELPTAIATPRHKASYTFAASIVALVGLMLLTYFLTQSTDEDRKVSVLEPIVTNITFNIPVAPITIERPIVVQQTIKKYSIQKIGTASSMVVATPNNAKKLTSLLVNQEKTFQVATSLSRHMVPLPWVEPKSAKLGISLTSNPSTEEELVPLVNKRKLPALGFNFSSSANGFVQGAGVGGGVSMLFSLTEKFSIEPGLGYGLMRYNNPASQASNEMAFARVAPTPHSDLRYRLRQSIEMPLSVHYRPVRQLALTGGLDIDLLISQRMIFAKTESSLVGSAYAKSLNDTEMNQLNRFNFGAHGGVSWFPVNEWKIGVYYGQKLLNQTKIDSKLKFSNQTYKVRLAHYF